MYIAEVVSAQIRSFKAQVLDNQEIPRFGAWVEVPQATGGRILGLVYQVTHESIEPNRQVEAYGKPREVLLREMPQIFELIRTYFEVTVLAYEDVAGRIRQTLPPHPAELHAFVSLVSEQRIRGLDAPYDFLRALVAGREANLPTDDLLVAVLGNMAQAAQGKTEAKAKLLGAGRALSRLMGDDHERLQSILRRVA